MVYVDEGIIDRKGIRLVIWAMQEFIEYGVKIEDVVEGLKVILQDTWYYSTDQKILHGIRDYLKEESGYKIPMRIGRYARINEVSQAIIDEILKEGK